MVLDLAEGIAHHFEILDLKLVDLGWFRVAPSGRTPKKAGHAVGIGQNSLGSGANPFGTEGRHHFLDSKLCGMATVIHF